MDVVDILTGALLLLIGFLVLIFAKSESKDVGSRFGYVFKIYVGGFGFVLIGIVMIVREIMN